MEMILTIHSSTCFQLRDQFLGIMADPTDVVAYLDE